MATKRLPFGRTRFAALVLFTSGTLFSTCTTRLKEATVDGATNFLFSTLLNPTTIAELLIPNDNDESDGV